jgi:phosphoglycolate phosphatase
MTATAGLVIFDLDGTLVDTAPDLIDSLNHTIAGAGLEPVGFEDLTHLVGQGARTMIARAFALRETELQPAHLDELFAVFLKHYRDNMPGRSKPYDGVVAAMDRLEAAGYALAICTNKSESLARALLVEIGLDHRFRAIIGGDSLPYRKPDGRHIVATAEAAGAGHLHAVMIGDSVNDIEAARNAAVPSIAVPFGYSDVPVHDLRPDHVIAHYDELTPALVERLLAGRRAA